MKRKKKIMRRVAARYARDLAIKRGWEIIATSEEQKEVPRPRGEIARLTDSAKIVSDFFRRCTPRLTSYK